MGAPIPKASSDTVEQVLIGHYRVSDVGDTIDDSNVKEEVGVGKDPAMRQKRFLVDIGLLKKDGHDYLLTQRGYDLGRYLDHEHLREDQAKELLQEVLLEWEPTDELFEVVDRGYQSRDDLFEAFEYATETPEADKKQRTNSGINALIDWYQKAGIITQNASGEFTLAQVSESKPEAGDKNATVTEQDEEDAQEEEVNGEDEEVVQEDGDGFNANQPPKKDGLNPSMTDFNQQKRTDTVYNVNLDISLEFSDESDPDKVEEILSSIRSALNSSTEVTIAENGDQSNQIEDLS